MNATLVNGLQAYEGSVVLPRQGVWTADVVCMPTNTPLAGQVTLQVGSLTLVGWAFQSGISTDQQWLRVFGGLRGGLIKTVPPQGYGRTTLRVVSSQLLQSVGELLSSTSTPSVLNKIVPMWARVAQPAGAALGMVADNGGAVWRVQPDGSTWLGIDTWPTVTPQFTIDMKDEPERNRSIYGVESFTLLPGTVLDGKRINTVEHRWSSDSAVGPRSVVRWENDQ